jgi:hypothetical protein
MRRIVSIVTTTGLAAALGAAVTASPAAATDPVGGQSGRAFEMRATAPAPAAQPRRTDGASQLISATATFSAANRANGMPTSTAPQHQFASIAQGGSLSVTIDYGYHWQTGELTYNYDLDLDMGAPDPETKTRAMLGFGVQNGTVCELEEATTDWLYRYIPDVLLYDNKETPDLASAAGWNCAVLAVDGGPGTTPYDAYVTSLDVVTAKPQLTLKAPKRDRLVKGVWTRIPVKVTNSSAEGINARDVAVVGTGKGVKVRRLTLGSLDGQDDTESHVWAKLAKPKAKLKLAVSEKGETLGRSTVKLTRRPAPAPPMAGRWSAPGVDFTVRGGKVRGFRISTQTRCGGYPDTITTTNNTYSFQTESIPRNNEVVGTEKGNQGGDAAYVAYLELEFVSKTKVKGKFSYYGPARCTAIDGFTARRKR